MLRLFVKESRQLLPIACLWIAVITLGYGIEFATERFDEMSFARWCEGYCDYDAGTYVIIFTALVALVTAYSLFPREYDDATIDFLRALPISRASVFVAKVLAAWVLLCSISILSHVFDAFMLSLNPESIGGRFYPQVWATLLLRDCIVGFILLSHGVLLSWFRTVGLVIYTIYLLLLMWAESALGTSGVWSIFTTLSNEYDGSRLLVNTQALGIHFAVAIGMLLVAYLLWSRTESSVSGGKQSTRGITILRGVLNVAAFLVLALFLFYRVGVGTGTGTAVTGDLKVATTEHYRFVYPAAKEDTVQYMLQHAEDDYRALAELLNVPDSPSIRVDLSAQSEHAAGLATWKKIQMDLDSFEADISQRRVLSHETTHVLQAVESDRAMARHAAATRFFIEGMAQYTSFEVVPEEARRDSNWQLAAVSWKRQNIEFNDLINEASFSERFDPELHYSLGDLWTRAFVDVCGESALGDFLRAAGRKDAVRDMPAGIFWRDTMSQISCDIDGVNEQWRGQMDELHESIDPASFPQYTDVVVARDEAAGQIVITASLEPYDNEADTSNDNNTSDATTSNTSSSTGMALPDRFGLRVAAASTRLAGGFDPVYRGQLVDDEQGNEIRVKFTIPEVTVSGSRFRYQLGFTISRDSRYYYESWKRGSL